MEHVVCMKVPRPRSMYSEGQPLLPPALHDIRVSPFSLCGYFPLLFALVFRYAIKKVVFRGIDGSHPRAQAVMREVQCLAQLDHKNIVRYHTSWLESGWVENGIGHGEYGAAKARARGAAEGGDGRHPDMGAVAATARALVPAHMQSQLIKGLETMVRSGDSASGSGSGWGWGAESDTGIGCGSGPGVCDRKAPGLGCRQGTSGRGRGLLRAGRGADRRGSMSPHVHSPKSLRLPLNTRERGFSRWSAEDLESDTSKWSEASSCTGRDCNDDGGGGGSGMGESGGTAAAAAAAFRKRGGGGNGRCTPSRSPARRWMPSVVRTLRSEQFRNPSIDMDDLVSFGSLSPAGGGTPSAQGVDDSCDENSEGWREWGAANSSDTVGGGARGFGRESTGHGGPGRAGEQRWARRRTVSPDRLMQYPVTLYIQMNLCPRDTLQDWLRNRNARLSSETEVAGSGVLFEDNARPSRAPPPTTDNAVDDPNGERPEPASDADATAPVPVLQNPPLLSDDFVGDKPRETPSSSPRTDPVTSASSGGSDDPSEGSSNDGDDGGGTLCPPPTRETSRELPCGSVRHGFDTTAGQVGGKTNTPKAAVSPARSVTSETGRCQGKSAPGTGRVDLHEALGLFRQLAEGVSHIHSKGIIHRDIKVCSRQARTVSCRVGFIFYFLSC